jgi:hypothetical protein
MSGKRSRIPGLPSGEPQKLNWSKRQPADGAARTWEVPWPKPNVRTLAHARCMKAFWASEGDYHA